MDVRPGETFAEGRYLITRVIGRGGMSTVYEAIDRTTDRRVAIKLLKSVRPGSDAVARFLQEARIAAMLPHEHVVEVTDVGAAPDGAPYIVLELLVGRDLAAELGARGRYPIGDAIDLVLQACEGLASAHAVGLVHRDVKPGNLFVVRHAGAAPRVKVLDFGFSKAPRELMGVTKSMTATNARFGTPQYMSPEQVRSTKGVDARTDQHAVALVLYELVTGQPAYQGKTAAMVLAELCTKPAPRMSATRPNVHPGLEAAVLRALEKEPQRRFEDLAAFADAIAPYGEASARASAARVRGLLVRPAPVEHDAAEDQQTRLRRRLGLMTIVALASVGFTLVLALLFLLGAR